MSYAVRILIALGGLLVFAFIILSIRKSKMVIGDSIFWFLFALVLMIIAIIPELFFFIARAFGVVSASNLAYLFLIVLLLIRVFQQDLKISQLNTKIQKLVQDAAIYQADQSSSLYQLNQKGTAGEKVKAG